MAAVESGRASFDVVKLPLLPYQREGAAHLAFHERALLADEMGLGKTVQAIAACEILARNKGVTRVLVVSPTSVKAEWEEQIARFTGRDGRFVAGLQPERLKLYAAPAFFTLVNYEQVVRDADDINRLLKPDVVILDEAQRIKNWQTKTARRVKSLRAPYAFVLTGTPLENRIDETLFDRPVPRSRDPRAAVPLQSRFLRARRARSPDRLQESRRAAPASGPVMLRRRKAEVERELPGRTVKTYFVPMSEEQKARYEDYRTPAAQLIAQAQRRPLRQQEFDRLQQLLACMRMICDTPAILDPSCRVSPKLEELEGILGDLLAEEPGRKIIVFSEWERMLDVGARTRRRDGRRGGLAHRLAAAASPPRRDQPVQAGPRLPVVPVYRQRQRRPQSAGRERRHQSSTCRGIRRSSNSASRAPGARTRPASVSVVNLVTENSASSIRSCICSARSRRSPTAFSTATAI